MKTNVKDCIPELDYEESCKKSNNFEYIPDDRPIKMYFDADHFFTEDFSSYNINKARDILSLHIDNIGLHLSDITASSDFIYSIGESHSPKRMKNGKEVWGYSFHIVITNFLVYKKDMKKLVEIVNRNIFEYQPTSCVKEQYETYEPELKGMINTFDTSVYSKGQQKIRSIYSSKDDEIRSFTLLPNHFIKRDDFHNFSLSFNDMVITGFFYENAFLYVSKEDTIVIDNVPKTKVPENIDIDDDIINKYIDYASICYVSKFKDDYMNFYKFSRASSNLKNSVPYV